MPRRTVLVMGFEGSPPLDALIPWRAVRNPHLRTELSRCPLGAVLLLGDTALRDCRPAAVLAVAQRHSCIVVACPLALPASSLVPWAQAGVAHIEDTRSVTATVLELARVPVLPPVPRVSWLPRVPRPGTLAASFVAAIPERIPPHLEAHLTALGTGRQKLRKETIRETDSNPSVLLHNFTRSKVRLSRRMGIRVGTIALGLRLDRATVRRYLN